MQNSLVIAFALVFHYARCQFLPYNNNPCPDVFQYIQSRTGILGQLQFQNDYSGYFELSVGMSVAAQLNSNQNIRLELRTSANDLVNGKPVTYFIYFPIQEVLPKPTQIVFNNKLYCTGPTEDLRPGITVTNMWATTYFKVSSPPSTNNPGLQFFLQFGDQSSTMRPSFAARPKPPETQILGEVTAVSVESSRPKPRPPTVAPPFTNPPVEQCGYPSVNAQNLIVNGKNVKEGEFPWLVAIMYRQNSDYRFRCTGSLISRRHVITAAHCVRYYQAFLFPIEDFLLVLGKNNIRNWASDAIIRDAENITVHPKYEQNKGDFDIAVIKLDKDVDMALSIKPVCIWDEDDVLDKVVGQRGTVVGWGKDEDGNQFVPDAKSVSLPIVSQVECLRSDPGFASVTSSRTFCAGNRDGSGPCTGDSGGGFYMNRKGRWTLRGVVSLSLGEAGTCDPSKYFVFVDAAKLRDWILASIA